ncbi:hypothetical protein ISG33_02300 [Glaciecola sp. MH2013]|uniref:hypothetical protein n=1 Tax=Glaciecola sp. MH2013 TaxID=2785524 RepID=UPI00189D9E98|nr:hypothetical protein [Glaciecola sp. MH2013]MBF7072232.1 hypothetical protein [Glaciecola sp. MH2013]
MKEVKHSKGLKIAVVFFAFNRPDKLKNTIKSYLSCFNAQTDDIFVYIDGPRNLKERVLTNECFQVSSELISQATIISREDNLGLKHSIHGGISDVLKQYEAVIVIEDDLKLEPEFYNYMRTGLIKYDGNEKVYQISGYNYNPEEGTDAFFLPIITSWGWATWRSRWKGFDLTTNYQSLLMTKSDKKRYNFGGSFNFSRMISLEYSGKISSWAIRWYSYVYSYNGLTLYPPQSLVVNDGFNDGGTHSSYTSSELFSSANSYATSNIDYPDVVQLCEFKVRSLQKHFRKRLNRKILGYIKSLLKRVFHVK